MMIVALNGYGSAGKDTVGDLLAEDGARKLAFADPMREMAVAINPIIGFLHGTPYRYCDALNDYGYTMAKKRFSEFRGFLQRLGTEAGRGVLGDDLWVDATMRRIHDDPTGDWVICDCRFPNEAMAVVKDGGIVVRVNRPGVGPANDHPSETALDHWAFDDVINNDGDLEQLRRKVSTMVDVWS